MESCQGRLLWQHQRGVRHIRMMNMSVKEKESERKRVDNGNKWNKETLFYDVCHTDMPYWYSVIQCHCSYYTICHIDTMWYSVTFHIIWQCDTMRCSVTFHTHIILIQYDTVSLSILCAILIQYDKHERYYFLMYPIYSNIFYVNLLTYIYPYKNVYSPLTSLSSLTIAWASTAIATVSANSTLKYSLMSHLTSLFLIFVNVRANTIMTRRFE